MTDVLHLQAHINAPAAKVYEALTASSALCTWLAKYAEVSIADDRFEFFGGLQLPKASIQTKDC